MMEGFQKTPIGDIPCDWKVSDLSEFTDEVTDYVAAGSFAALRENVNVFSEPNHAIYVRLTDLRKGLGHSEQKYVDKESYDFLSKSNLYGREILFANIGANVGEVWMMPEIEKEATVAPNMIVIRANNESVVPEYLHAYLCSSIGLRQIDKIIAGSGHPKINKTELRRLSAILPPPQEQQKIAEILSTVDAKIEVIDQQISETQELKKGLMQRLLTKGIGHTEFKDSSLGKIPKSWEVSNLANHSAFITKGSTPTTYGFDWVESGIQFLRSECVSSTGFNLKGAMFISEEANNAMERSKIIGGDILMTITGNVGRVCIYPYEYKLGNINQHIARIRIEDLSLSSQFIFQYLSQSTIIHEYLKITTGQAYPQLSLKQVRETKIPLPPIEEQQKIAEILSSVDEKLEVLEGKKAYYQELKQGLMQQLLTGKVRVKTGVAV
ncbi:restriction endonuclease subunit S [Hyunsoonleella rubra]|uniref:Restriction endonuclease subunit S n=1 Tax=Hyunsoonleella rubra TaxID=1737062 RepID=A0ABW5TAK2_9FLAO